MQIIHEPFFYIVTYIVKAQIGACFIIYLILGKKNETSAAIRPLLYKRLTVLEALIFDYITKVINQYTSII